MLHTTAAGDIIMSRTLNCIHTTKDPMYRYDVDKYMTPRGRDKPDKRLIAYENFERKRYENLGLNREPTSINNVARIYNDRFGEFQDRLKQVKKSVPHIVRSKTTLGYEFIQEKLPTDKTTMVSKGFNKIIPFVTEKNKSEVQHLLQMIS